MIDAGVAHLAAGLAVERRLVDDDRARLAGLRRSSTSLPSTHERRDDALGGLGVVAEELGRAELLAQRRTRRLGRRLAGAGPGGARLGLLRSMAR
jgi:hypothetical protein